MRKVLLSGITCLALLASLAGVSQAAVVTVGSPLTQPFVSTEAKNSGTIANIAFPEPGANVTSPVSGTVIRWRIGQAEGGPFRLRILRAAGPEQFAGTGSGPDTTVPPGTNGISVFPVNLPIKTGDLLGLDLVNGAKIGTLSPVPGSGFAAWKGFVPEGSAQVVEEERGDREIAFNADVLPPPTATAMNAASGSFKGGGTVTIEGTDLIEVSAVTFGSVPAASFSSGSETSLTAVAPQAAKPGTVEVSVTTPAGTATVPSPYAYKACKVPGLRGRTLANARKRLRRAGCKLGKVKRLRGRDRKVSAQKPKPGKLKAPGAKVKVTVG
jgi:hypothetical protein